jgi:predicted phage terminase large subunit-like protein
MTLAAQDVKAYLAEAATQELARRSLLDFARYVYPGFEDPPHIQLLADLLERVEQSAIRKLIVALPVRHGKSVLCSQIFTAWFIGRNPRRSVISSSHSEDLAVRNSRIAKQLVEDDRWPFEARLATDSTSAQRWNTREGGGCYSIGVGGGITGRGADVLLIDDALHDGQSQNEMDKCFAWYSEVALPRLEPGGRVIVVGARFADQDLCGQILESPDGPNWHVVNIPAIAEEGDVLGREPGEALWPSRMNLDELAMRRVSMSSRAFEAQFQQNPVPAGGKFYKLEWLSHRYELLPATLQIPETADDIVRRTMFGEERKPGGLIVVQAIDSAWKTGPSSDYSVIATIASDLVNFYIIDIWRQRVQYPDLRRSAIELYELFRPRIVYVEEAASGFAVVQELKVSTPFPVVGVKPVESKEARAEAVLPLWESGRVKIRADASWTDELIAEFLRFPGGRHDDQVDALNLGLAQLWDYVRRHHTRRQTHANVFPWKER